MIKKVFYGLSLILVTALLMVALPVLAAEENVLNPHVECSVQDSETTGLGLAFQFRLNASDIAMDDAQRFDNTKATVLYDGQRYPLLSMGAVVTNDATVAKNADRFVRESDDGRHRVVDISAKYLCEVTEDGCSYAVRIINMPNREDVRTAMVYARPYYVIKQQNFAVTVYGDVHATTYQTELEKPPAPEIGTIVSVYYGVKNVKAGKISGTKQQYIEYGVTTTEQVWASAKVGFRFSQWSDGVKTPIRSGETFREDTEVYALFEEDPLELPIVNITTCTGAEVTSKEEYIDGTIALSNCDEQYAFEPMDMEIRGRGNHTWWLEKKPYRIKLSKKKNLLGQGSGPAKVWVLLADHCDQSLLRNHTALNYARKLDGLAFISSAQSVEVYFNGEYRGVYLLCEQNQVNEERVNIAEEPESVQTGYLVQLSGYAEDPKFVLNMSNGERQYEVKNDLSTDTAVFNQQMAFIEGVFQQAWDAVLAGDQEQIESLIDIPSVVDSYLVEELFKNLDAGWDSFYFHYDATVAGEKLHFGPIWDFDLTGGNVNEETNCDKYEGLHAGTMESNAWFAELLKYSWFRNLVAQRWDELKAETDKIPETIRTTAQAGYTAYCRNFLKWPIFGERLNREPAAIRALDTYKKHYEYYANWMANRIQWLDTYYDSLEYNFDGELALQGQGTQEAPYLITNEQDFVNFTLCMLDGETFTDHYFRQTADLDMRIINGYTGIGASATFDGIYDGGGRRIHAELAGSDQCIFPYLTGTVMNVFTSGTITNTAQAAGICRSVRIGGKVINCGSTMTLSGSFTGGIAASNQAGGGSIINCYFAGSVTGTNSAAPINCYVSDRGGDYVNNYYLNTVTHTNKGVLANCDETALSREDMCEKLADYLNAGRAEAAQWAGVDEDAICLWAAQSNDFPLPIAL